MPGSNDYSVAPELRSGAQPAPALTSKPEPSIGKLGDPYTNLPKVYTRGNFEETALKEKYGSEPSRRDRRQFKRYLKSDAGIADRQKYIDAENTKEQASYSAYAKALGAQSKARMLAAKADFDKAIQKFDAPVEPAQPPVTPSNKPTVIPRSDAEWNRIASENGFKDMAEVKAWQAANGLVDDGKFGNNSSAYFKTNGLGKYQRTPSTKVEPPTPVAIATPLDTAKLSSRDTAKVAVVDINKISQPIDTTKAVAVDSSKVNKNTPQIASPTESTTKFTPNFNLEDFWMNNDDTYYNLFVGTDYVRYDPKGFGDFYVDKNGRIYEATLGGAVGKEISQSSTLQHTSPYYHDTKRGKAYRALRTLLTNSGAVLRKQGGTMNRINYFQQGGAAPQQDIKAQVTALVQAAMQGDQKATQQVNQIMEAAKAGDQQAIQIAQLMEQVIKEMQGQAVAAKYGAKLSYLQSLKCGGKSMKKKEQGGKVCPECEKEKIIKKNYFGGSVDKFGDGGETRQPNKKNLRFFDRRSTNIGNDRQVITETVYDYDDGYGNWLGDLAKILGTRTIYKTPTQNDTVYSYTHDPKIYLGTNTGYMGVAKQEADQNGAKTNFLQQVRTTVLPENQNTEEAKARRRAWIEGE